MFATKETNASSLARTSAGKARNRGASLRLEGLCKNFGPVVAVQDLSLTVGQGKFLTLLGASGSGKSTTLMMIAGFLLPDSGEIYLDDQVMSYTPPYKRDLGMVFQNYALFPHMRVFDNIAFPLKMRRHGKAQIKEKVEAVLDLVKLGGFEDRYPRQLSGGQQQRVALARAIVADPQLLLMDEPLAALDKKLREHMQLELKTIQRRLGLTVVYVTHDQTEALVMSDQIAVVHAGGLEQIGTPREVYDRPTSRLVAEFIGESNFLEGTVHQVDGETCLVQCDGLACFRSVCPPGTTIGQSVSLAVRPERICIRASETCANHVAGEIEDSIYVGEAVRYHVRISKQRLLTVKETRSAVETILKPGQSVRVGWNAEDVMLVGRSTGTTGDRNTGAANS